MKLTQLSLGSPLLTQIARAGRLRLNFIVMALQFGSPKMSKPKCTHDVFVSRPRRNISSGMSGTFTKINVVLTLLCYI